MEDLRNMQLEMVKMIANIDKLFRENDIKYTLLGGSVLGAVRHKGFIPWDDDMDIAVWRKDFEKVEKLLSNLDGFIYDFAQTNQIARHYPIGKLHLVNEQYSIDFSPTIDIFALDKVPNNTLSVKFLNLIVFLCRAATKRESKKPIKHFIFTNTPKIILDFIQKITYNYIINLNKKNYENLGNVFGAWKTKEYFLANIYENLIFVEFEDLKLPIPQNYNFYLTQMYGDYMKLPPVEKRTPRHKD